MASEKLAFFLQDGAAMCESLGVSLGRLAEEPGSEELINQAFRYIHSIKSEASFLDLDAISSIAHEMEGHLEGFRRDGVANPETLKLVEEMREDLAERIDRAEELSAGGVEGRSALSADGTGARASGDHGAAPRAPIGPTGGAASEERGRSPEGPSTGRGLVPTDFERTLLREAWERGERFYRLACTIEESAPIKFAKAYLVVNNLELVANVIRTIPTLEPREDDEFREFEVYLTASVGEQEIREAIDLDQIERIVLHEVDFDSYAEQTSAHERTEDRRTVSEAPSIRVTASKLDEMAEYVGELKLLLSSPPSKAHDTATSISSLVVGLDRLLNELRSVPIREELIHLPRFARDLARRLGKQVRVRIEDNAVVVHRRLLAQLSDPLHHLVRNAVDHGIELPMERELRGKDPVGLITVSAAEVEGELVIEVSDDGAGIDPAAIVAKARDLGMVKEGEGTPDPLSILVKPGFSTREHADSISGRGVGLDVVFDRITRMLGGKLELAPRSGPGASFRLTLPAASNLLSVLLARCGRQTIGFSTGEVVATRRVADVTIQADQHGVLRFGGLPIRRLQGLAFEQIVAATAPKALPPTGFLIEVSRLGRRHFLYADELLVERDLPAELLTVEGESGTGLFTVSIGGERADFLLARL